MVGTNLQFISLFTPPFVPTGILKNNVDEGPCDEINHWGLVIYFAQSQNEDGIHDANNDRF